MKKLIILYLVIIGLSFVFTSANSYDEVSSLSTVRPATLECLVDTSKKIYPQLTERLETDIQRYCKYTGFNGAILVVYKGDIVFRESYGYAKFSDKSKLNINTPFQLASTGKQFTAHAIMKLHADGLLNYDDPVAMYIPEFTHLDITIRQLLHHTGGMYNYMYLLDNNDGAFEELDNKQLMTMLSKSEIPLYYKPGTRFDYSNTGYAVLAAVVEYITNMDFGEYLEKTFFIPLGMNNTYVHVNDYEHREIEAQGHYRSRGRYYAYRPSVHDCIVGDKGVYSTVIDMYKWDRAMNNGTIIPIEILNEAFKPSTTIKGRKVNYGFGYRLKETNGRDIVFHNGLWEGFRTAFYKYQDIDGMIIVLNNTSFNVNPVSQKISKILYEYEEDYKNIALL